MRITIFSFTHNGAALAASLAKDLVQSGHLCQAFTMPKYAAEFHLQAMKKSVKDLTGSFFSSEDALIYIGACGIAVRAIAPFLQDKTTDPCVLSIDEQGRYVISLLSGHIGGGNELAIQAAWCCSHYFYCNRLESQICSRCFCHKKSPENIRYDTCKENIRCYTGW